MNIEFDNAYYIKLGEKGSWENELLTSKNAKIGWDHISLDLILSDDWKSIQRLIAQNYSEGKKKSGATQDFNALKNFCKASDRDVFITFHYSKLYWCFLSPEIKSDGNSKYRSTINGWSSKDVDGNDLFTCNLTGNITKIQGFRGTLCKVEDKEALYKILNNQKPPFLEKIQNSKDQLCENIEAAFTELNPYDCENLSDLIFRQSGWQRLSNLGKQMKDFDMELWHPLTNVRMQVQVKAKADRKVFERYASDFKKNQGAGLNKFCFMVYVPDKTLKDSFDIQDNVRLMLPKEIAELIVDLGLVEWVKNKLKK